MPPAPVVVFAVGNPSRGDDALGPHLLARLAESLEARGLAAGFELIEDFQLQIEHALDLEGRALALFVDAGEGTPAPYSFSRIEPALHGIGHSTHALAPDAVLRVFAQTLGSQAPPAYLLCVRGESFELGEPLSDAALANAAKALELLASLTADADSPAWDRQCAENQR